MRVLVTRPEPGASRTAARLVDAGFTPVVVPLTEIRPLDPPEADLAACDLVAATSANAFRHAKPALLARLREKPCYVVGSRTAELALQAGFSHVVDADGDVTRLIDRIASSAQPGSSIAYLAGRVRRKTLEQALAEKGFDLRTAEVYDTLPKHWPAERLRQALGTAGLDAVLVFSSQAAEILGALTGAAGAEAIADAVFCCISARAAAPLQTLERPVFMAERPTEQALLALLQRVGTARP